MGHQNNSYMYNPDNYDPVTGNLKDPVLQQFAQDSMQPQVSSGGVLGQYQQDGYTSGGAYAEEAKKDGRPLAMGETWNRLGIGSRPNLNPRQYRDMWNADGTPRNSVVMDNLNPVNIPATATESSTAPEPQTDAPPVDEYAGVDAVDGVLTQGAPVEDRSFRSDGVLRSGSNAIPALQAMSLAEPPANTSRKRDLTGEDWIRMGGAMVSGSRNGATAATAAATQEYGRIKDGQRAQDQQDIENAQKQQELDAAERLTSARNRGLTAQQQMDSERLAADAGASIDEFTFIIDGLQKAKDGVTGPWDGTVGQLWDSKFGSGAASAERQGLRLRMEQVRVNEILLNTAKTKGAITEKEMFLFQKPMPKMSDSEQTWSKWAFDRRAATVDIQKRLQNKTSVPWNDRGYTYGQQQYGLSDADEAEYRNLTK